MMKLSIGDYVFLNPESENDFMLDGRVYEVLEVHKDSAVVYDLILDRSKSFSIPVDEICIVDPDDVIWAINQVSGIQVPFADKAISEEYQNYFMDLDSSDDGIGDDVNFHFW